MYSALASLEPDLPRAPVNLLNTTPLPRNAAFLASKADAYNGSKPALTSEDNMRLRSKLRRTANGDLLPAMANNSATTFSNQRDCMPVAPTEPISSLSTNKVQVVRFTLSTSSIAAKEV